MKIGIDATIIDSTKPSGMAVYAINVIREMAKLYEDLVVWVVEDDLLDIPGHFKRPVLQAFRGRKTLLPWVRAFWTQFILPGLILREGVDIFFSPIPEGMLYPPVPQVLVVHDLVPLAWSEDSPFLRRISFKTRVPLALRASSYIISVSYSTKKDLISLLSLDENKISVVYEGYDSRHFTRLGKDKAQSVLAKYSLEYGRYFLFVGNFTPRKNIIGVVEAFSYVARLTDKIPLVLTGDMDFNRAYTDLIIAKVKDLQLEPRVHFLDYVPYKDLPYLYNGAIALVFPSFYEGFGLPVLEAMACGIPAIVSDINSLLEVSGNSAFCVRNNKSEMISFNFLDLLLNCKLRRDCINGGKVWLKSFSWDKTALEVFSILKSL